MESLVWRIFDVKKGIIKGFLGMSILLEVSKDRPQTLLMPRFNMPLSRHDAFSYSRGVCFACMSHTATNPSKIILSEWATNSGELVVREAE